LKTDPVELLQALVRFDTSNPPGNERACIEFVGALLEKAGIEHRYFAFEPERPNVVARIPGRGDAPPLLLYGHVDVVPADAREWKHPPFGGDLVDGEVWGRGALDMKGGVAMIVASILRLSSSETPPPGDVIVVLTSDEEAGSRTGMKFLVEAHAELFDGVRYALSEFGGFTLWHGRRRFMPIQVTEKQRCLVRATVRGTGGHAASVVQGSASGKLGVLLSRLSSRRLPVRVTSVARQMLEAMGDALPLHERVALRGLLVPAVSNQVLRLPGAATAMAAPLLCNTATPTMVEGGTATNMIPTELSVELDGRVLPGATPSDLLRELEMLAPGLATFELVNEEPAVPANPDLALMPLLASVLKEHDPGCVPIATLVPGYTDARYVSKLGIQTYGFLPMRLPRHIGPALIHAPDERVPAEAVEFGAACLIDAINKYR
jgi:acetylornithine deacetylase/succinyl-diaminopimelate desuccinylase-like protein